MDTVPTLHLALMPSTVTAPSLPNTEVPTFHHPRILCLHGGGTNARIFRMQCRVLEHSLRHCFRLVYAEGPFPAQPGPDVTSVYRNYGPFKAWQLSTPLPDDRSIEEQDRAVVDQISAAMDATMHADDQQGATGEWVGLLGFSQGAKIAASILFAQQARRQRRSERNGNWSNFRFGLLLAGRGPLVWLAPELPMPQGLVNASRPYNTMATDEPKFSEDDSDDHVLRTPTIHVHGLRDPGLELHRKMLQRYCNPCCATLLEWDGGHRVPIKTKDVHAVVEQVYAEAWKLGLVCQWK
ncbi:MAG: hypothetical protein Q9213_003867 [Squamulea squamosa]